MLKEFREKKGITQEKLSDITNIDRKTIFRIENDINSPLIENYAKIVIALQLTDQQIADHIREIAMNLYKKEKNKPFDEKECIHYITGTFCNLENPPETCCICNNKIILKEGQEIQVEEKYTIKRKKRKNNKNMTTYEKYYVYNFKKYPI